MDKLYTAQEIADKLKIKKNTVYELIKRGELSSSKIGKQIRISQQDIEDYIGRNSEGEASSRAARPDLSGAPTPYVESSVVKMDYLRYANGLIFSGHDPLLDLLCSQISVHPQGLPVLRSHVGSYDALYSLYFKKIHVAALHLWNKDEKSYNASYIRHFLPGIEVILLHFVKRSQGFFVQKGNPLKIRDFKDLTRKEVRFINRELGSGTRILLDGHLSLNDILPEEISGYRNEVLSHFASASAVFSDEADAALGCESQLSQFPQLDFVPIQTEAYDLAFLKSDLEKPVFIALIKILCDRQFQNIISGIRGYDISEMGSYEIVK